MNVMMIWVIFKKKEREKVVKNHDGALIHLPRQTPFPFEERG